MVAIGSEVVVLSAGAFNLFNATAMNVLDFGAKNTGLTTDAATNNTAFTNAFNALPANGGVIIVPAGTYYVTGLTFKDKFVFLIGDGGTAQTYGTGNAIRPPTILASTTNATIVNFTSTDKTNIVGQYSGMQGIGILGNNAGTSQIGLLVDNRGVRIYDCDVAACYENIQIADCVGGRFQNVTSYKSAVGSTWRIDTTLGTGTGKAVTSTVFDGCKALSSAVHGWHCVGNITSLEWLGGFSESAVQKGFFFDSSGGLGPIGCHLLGVHDEANGTASIHFNNANVVDNLAIFSHHTSPAPIDGGRNYVWGPRQDLTGVGQRYYHQIGDLVNQRISSADLAATRTRAIDNSSNGNHVSGAFISTFGITVGPTVTTDTLAVPQGVNAFNCPYDRGVSWRNQANSANIDGLHMGDVVVNALTVDGASTGGVVLARSGSRVGFYGGTPVVKDTGWAAATNTKTKTTFDTTTVTLPVLAAHVGALMDVLINNGMIGA